MARRLALLIAVLFACAATPAAAATYPPGFEERTIAAGLTGPVGVAWTPDGRMIVIEKFGRVRIFAAGGATPATVVDLSARVNSYWDRGLLGIAVDSSFEANRYVYLLYTAELNPFVRDGSSPAVSRLARYQLSDSNQLTDETIILGKYNGGVCPLPSNTVDCIPSEGPSHSIGSVRSAPDGTLYVGSGDAASFGFTDRLALRTYDERSLAGKIVHIDRDGRGLPGHPFCPANNDLGQVCTKLYAKGFRNPYRFKLRPDGGLTVGDVGWNTREEVDLISSGGRSYGWPCYEGTIRTPGYNALPECAPEYAKEGTADAHAGPSYDYPHAGSAAIQGGPTYQGSGYPPGFQGRIFFGDYAAGFIKTMRVAADGSVADVEAFADGWYGTDLETAPSGDLAFVDFGDGSAGTGSVKQVVYSSDNGSPVARATAGTDTGPAPLEVSFSSAGSSDPDGDPLAYSWDFGDGSASTDENPTHTYAESGVYTATLTVSDGRGGTGSATVRIVVGGSPPTATIEVPADESLYRDGDTITVRGSATDIEDGAVPASGLSWNVVVHHATHIHQVGAFDGVAEASFVALRDHDADSYYEITLRATDSSGLTDTTRARIRPETVPLTLASDPPGASVSYAGSDAVTPFATSAAIGFRTTISASRSMTGPGGRPYVFDGWSDGGALSHDIEIPATATTLTATYLEDKASGRPAGASSSATGREPGKAVDGSAATSWSSSGAGSQWWVVDVGPARRVSGVEVDWDAAYASRYEILTSLDGSNWASARQTAALGPGTQRDKFAARSARYVLVHALERATPAGFSFSEVRVVGPVDDTTPPETTIGSGPEGTTGATSASFTFSSSEPGSSFGCRLDGASWAPCTSPTSYDGLSEGAHTFEVRATDAAGNTDLTPASRTWNVGTAGYAETVAATPGLVNWWRLDDAGTTAADSRGTGAGTFVGGPVQIAGLTPGLASGSARDFDGVNDFVDLPPAAFGTPASFSVETWVRLDSRKSGAGLHFIAADTFDQALDGFTLHVDTLSRPRFSLGQSAGVGMTVIAPFDLKLGGTYHVVATYDGTDARLFVNGVQRASAAYTGGVAYHPSRQLHLGSQPKSFNRGVRFLDGKLDEVALYDRALPASTVNQHYLRGR